MIWNSDVGCGKGAIDIKRSSHQVRFELRPAVLKE